MGNPPAVPGFTEIWHNGARCRVPIIRSKRKVAAVIYGGVLYPELSHLLPEAPERADDNVIVRDSAGNPRYLRVAPMDADEATNAAVPIAMAPGGLDLVEQPLRGRAEALRAHPGLPAEVTPVGADAAMSRGRWIGLGLRHSRPGPITPAQTDQLLRAAFWSTSAAATPEQRTEGERVVGYYAAAGYTAVSRRPYRRKN